MGKVIKKHERYWHEIAIFGDYLPWNVHKGMGGDRSNFPAHSGRILDLKDGSPRATAHFGEMVGQNLADEIVIAIVPSHDPAKPSKGLKNLAAELAKTGKRINGADCLVRTKKIDKLAHGGDRSEEVHLHSVSVETPVLVKGRDVLLIDDVTKTGHSLAACRKLLLKAGAKSVECAAIGLV